MVMEEVVDKVHDITNHKRSVVEASTTINIDLIEHNLLHAIKLHTMIQTFMETILKDMRTLEDSIAMHNVVLEELTYHRIISLYDMHDITNHRRSIIEASTTINTDLIEHNLLHAIKFHTMIKTFMETILKDMRTLKDSIAMHNVVLEELAYCRIRSLYDQLEAWTTYLWEKSCRIKKK
jgi:hypothetical protein